MLNGFSDDATHTLPSPLVGEDGEAGAIAKASRVRGR